MSAEQKKKPEDNAAESAPSVGGLGDQPENMTKVLDLSIPALEIEGVPASVAPVLSPTTPLPPVTPPKSIEELAKSFAAKKTSELKFPGLEQIAKPEKPVQTQAQPSAKEAMKTAVNLVVPTPEQQQAVREKTKTITLNTNTKTLTGTVTRDLTPPPPVSVFQERLNTLLALGGALYNHPRVGSVLRVLTLVTTIGSVCCALVAMLTYFEYKKGPYATWKQVQRSWRRGDVTALKEIFVQDNKDIPLYIVERFPHLALKRAEEFESLIERVNQARNRAYEEEFKKGPVSAFWTFTLEDVVSYGNRYELNYKNKDQVLVFSLEYHNDKWRVVSVDNTRAPAMFKLTEADIEGGKP